MRGRTSSPAYAICMPRKLGGVSVRERIGRNRHREVRPATVERDCRRRGHPLRHAKADNRYMPDVTLDWKRPPPGSAMLLIWKANRVPGRIGSEGTNSNVLAAGSRWGAVVPGGRYCRRPALGIGKRVRRFDQVVPDRVSRSSPPWNRRRTRLLAATGCQQRKAENQHWKPLHFVTRSLLAFGAAAGVTAMISSTAPTETMRPPQTATEEISGRNSRSCQRATVVVTAGCGGSERACGYSARSAGYGNGRRHGVVTCLSRETHPLF